MPTDKQIRASKANGALSHGPTTEQGKLNSARNSIRHGLLARTVVLEEEIAGPFIELLEAFTDEFQPRTASQALLVETMAVARWRLERVWGLQKSAIDREIALQDPSIGPAPVRALAAFRGSPDSPCPVEVLLRYETAFDRQFSRALTRLLALQSLPDNRPLTPYHPESPAGHTWKAPTEQPQPGKQSGTGQAPAEAALLQHRSVVKESSSKAHTGAARPTNQPETSQRPAESRSVARASALGGAPPQEEEKTPLRNDPSKELKTNE